MTVRAEALQWLLEPSDPPIRLSTLTDVLGKARDEEDVRIARQNTLSYEPVVALRQAQEHRGYWPPDSECYNPKFTATVWQLMILAEMGVPRTSWIESAVERFFHQHQRGNGSFDDEVCLTGHMTRSLFVLGYGDDTRINRSLNWLPDFQLEDGGWNCDYPKYNPKHSSFMSTIDVLWAFSEIPKPSLTRKLKKSLERGAEFLLSHRVYKSHRDGMPVDLHRKRPGPDDPLFTPGVITRFHFPMYYYYDALHGLRVLAQLGYNDDERISDAIDLVLSKRSPEGRWLLEGDWVRERSDEKRKTLVTIEKIMKPSKWITLNCYRVLAKTGDLELPD
jgi:hypothetical protein